MAPDLQALLVDRARRGDSEAFAELVRPLWPRLYRLALRFLQDPGRAEDLSQEALTRAWLRLSQLRTDAAFAPWLLRIAANLARNEIGRRSEVPAEGVGLQEPALGADLDAGLLRSEAKRRLERALRELSPLQRVAVELVLRDELSYREAAQILGIPVGTVKTLVHRGRGRLRRALEGDAKEWEGGAVHARADY